MEKNKPGIKCGVKNCLKEANKVSAVGMVLCNKHFKECAKIIDETVKKIKTEGAS